MAGRGPWLGVVTIAAGLALSALAWTGHGAAGEGAIGWAHLLADILHLIAAGAWVGALIGLMLLVVRPAKRVDAAHLVEADADHAGNRQCEQADGGARVPAGRGGIDDRVGQADQRADDQELSDRIEAPGPRRF